MEKEQCQFHGGNKCINSNAVHIGLKRVNEYIVGSIISLGNYVIKFGAFFLHCTCNTGR